MFVKCAFGNSKDFIGNGDGANFIFVVGWKSACFQAWNCNLNFACVRLERQSCRICIKHITFAISRRGVVYNACIALFPFCIFGANGWNVAALNEMEVAAAADWNCASCAVDNGICQSNGTCRLVYKVFGKFIGGCQAGNFNNIVGVRICVVKSAVSCRIALFVNMPWNGIEQIAEGCIAVFARAVNNFYVIDTAERFVGGYVVDLQWNCTEYERTVAERCRSYAVSKFNHVAWI